VAIVYVVEADLQGEILTPEQNTGPHDKLFLDSGPNNVGIVKTFRQFAFGTITCQYSDDSVISSHPTVAGSLPPKNFL
jgi:hypothetical protein